MLVGAEHGTLSRERQASGPALAQLAAAEFAAGSRAPRAPAATPAHVLDASRCYDGDSASASATAGTSRRADRCPRPSAVRAEQTYGHKLPRSSRTRRCARWHGRAWCAAGAAGALTGLAASLLQRVPRGRASRGRRPWRVVAGPRPHLCEHGRGCAAGCAGRSLRLRAPAATHRELGARPTCGRARLARLALPACAARAPRAPRGRPREHRTMPAKPGHRRHAADGSSSPSPSRGRGGGPRPAPRAGGGRCAGERGGPRARVLTRVLILPARAAALAAPPRLPVCRCLLAGRPLDCAHSQHSLGRSCGRSQDHLDMGFLVGRI